MNTIRNENLPKIAMLWIGGRLSFLEQLCMQSFLDKGHEVLLYLYDEVDAVPQGVQILDAREIYRGAPFRVHLSRGSPAVHADFFRVKLMQRGGGEIWADTDAYCYKPFDFAQTHIYGHLEHIIGNGVMRLPPESEALRLYDAFLESAEPDAVFLPPQVYQAIEKARAQGQSVPIEAMPWGASGPDAFTHFLKLTGEIEHAFAEKVFYPTTWITRRKFLQAPRRFMQAVTDETVSFHFYGRVTRRILAEEFGGLPKPGSILDVLCQQHDIDAQAAPIV